MSSTSLRGYSDPSCRYCGVDDPSFWLLLYWLMSAPTLSTDSSSPGPVPRWLWIAGGVLLVALAIWVFRAPVPTVEDYRDELTALAAPSTPGDAAPLAIGARALLDGTAVDPIRADQIRRAARWFENAALTVPDETGRAAFYAGLAWQLGGREDLSQQWFGEVPEDSPYARAARAALTR